MEFEDLVGLEQEDLLEYIFSEKSKGYSSEQILNSLMTRGLTEDEAVGIMFVANDRARKKTEEGNHALLLGLFLLLAGIGIRLVLKSSGNVTVIDIISYCLILAGVLKLINGWFKLSTYGKWKKL